MFGTFWSLFESISGHTGESARLNQCLRRADERGTKGGLPPRRQCGQAVRPGVDVTITIFCDFLRFLAKKLAFFSKNNVLINFMQKLTVV
jgi:hypothetical protein